MACIYKYKPNTKEEQVFKSDEDLHKFLHETFIAPTESKTQVEEKVIPETPQVNDASPKEDVKKVVGSGVGGDVKPTPNKVKVLGKDVNMYNDYIPSKVEDVEADAMYSFSADSKDGIPSILHDVAYANKREVNGIKSENWHASISGDELLKLYPKKAVEQSLPTQEVKTTPIVSDTVAESDLTKNVKTEPEKKISDKANRIADQFEKRFTDKTPKIKGKDGKELDIFTSGVSWNDTVKGIADLIRSTGDVVQSIHDYLHGQEWFKGLSDEDKTAVEGQVADTFKSDNNEEWTAVRKEKLKEIKGTQKLFEERSKVKWTETYDNALNHLQEMYPNKPLYEAMKSRVSYFADQLAKNKLFNPTSEDIAVFNVFRAETNKRISDIEGWDSADDNVRLLATQEFEGLQNDLFNIARVTNPEGEAGRAFAMLQSEIMQDPKNGLKIRRMQLLDAKGGEQLTPEELSKTAEQWDKEKELMTKIHEAEKQSQKEKFEKQLTDLQNDYEAKLKNAKAKTPKVDVREKTLSQKGKDVADIIRKFKMPKGAKFDFTLGSYDLAIEGIAKLVEAGATITEAITQLIKDGVIAFKHEKDKSEFEDDLVGGFVREQNRTDSLGAIKAYAKDAKVSDITSDMVAKNLIKNYVEAHIGDTEIKDVLDKATEELKTVLPDVTREQVADAYLKSGEFKQPTKKAIVNADKLAKSKLQKLTKLEKDISDLKNKKTLAKKANKKTEPIDSEIAAKQKELKQELINEGIKIASIDKHAKAANSTVAEAHNERVDSVIDKVNDKINDKATSPEEISDLKKLRGQLEASKIKFSDSKIESQKNIIDNAAHILDNIDDAAKGTFSKDIQKLADQLSTDRNEKEQDVKLQRAKDKTQREINEYERKLNAGEFDEPKPVTLTKTDAELINLQREKLKLETEYHRAKKEAEERNMSGVKLLALKTGKLVRAAFVSALVGGSKTFAKIGAMTLLRPAAEATTKLTLGKVFDKIFPGIAKQARGGGESSDWRHIKKGFEAYFRQFSPKQLEQKWTKSNEKFEQSDKNYNVAKENLQQAKDTYGEDSKQYKSAQKNLDSATKNRNEDLLDVVGNVVYNFIGGSSIKDALTTLVHRTSEIEKQFGNFDTDSWKKFQEGMDGKDKAATAMDNAAYIINFFGRSHSAIKTFSGRFSFVSTFMARLEHAASEGVDLSDTNKIIEIANESYLDWDRGKYQQSNKISDSWNKLTAHLEKDSPALAELMKTEVPITRVPVNVLNEAITQYTFGAFRAAWDISKEYLKARKIVIGSDYGAEGKKFKEALSEQIGKLDKDKAAIIYKCFRKGGFGLGIYALTLFGAVQFGGFPHIGQTAEDKKKKKGELKTGEISIFGVPLGQFGSSIIRHVPFMYPALMGDNMGKKFYDDIKSGKSTLSSANDAAMSQLQTIVDDIPQAKIFNPIGMAKGIIGTMKTAPLNVWHTWTGYDKSEHLQNMDIVNPDVEKALVALQFDKQAPSQKEIVKVGEGGKISIVTDDEYNNFSQLVNDKFNQEMNDNLNELTGMKQADAYDKVDEYWAKAKKDALIILGYAHKPTQTTNPFDEEKTTIKGKGQGGTGGGRNGRTGGNGGGRNGR